MDLFSFYNGVIDDEIKCFHITKRMLQNSLVAINDAYSKESLSNGKTFVDYNMPSNRCAYLCKFGPSHTEMTRRYFWKFIRDKPEIRSIFKKRSTLKICCLGGGGGCDALGMLLALTLYPYFLRKVLEITVFDICDGWSTTFERIIMKFFREQEKCRERFEEGENVRINFVKIDFLEKLTDPASKVIREADIVCMVKFVSAVVSMPSAGIAFQNLALNMKDDAIAFNIDNFRKETYGPIGDIFRLNALRCVYGPLHVWFTMSFRYPFKLLPGMSMKGINSLLACGLSVLGWIKNSSHSVASINEFIFPSSHFVSHEVTCLEEHEVWEIGPWNTCFGIKNSVGRRPSTGGRIRLSSGHSDDCCVDSSDSDDEDLCDDYNFGDYEYDIFDNCDREMRKWQRLRKPRNWWRHKDRRRKKYPGNFCKKICCNYFELGGYCERFCKHII